MIKGIIAGVAVSTISAVASADLVLGYNLQSEPGNQASSAATTVGPSIAADVLSRASITATTGTASMNANAFTVGSFLNLANNDYYRFGFTVDAGTVSIDVTSIVFGLQRSSSGPALVALYYTIDGGTTLTQIGSNASASTTAGPVTFTPGSTLTFQPGTTVQFRLYGWNGTNTAGTLRITAPNSGPTNPYAIAVVPTPGSGALLGVGMLAAARRRRA